MRCGERNALSAAIDLRLSNVADEQMFGGIEAGGTKFILGIGQGPGRIVARTSIPTTTPDETLSSAIAWFADQPRIDAIGIASFGPLNLDRADASYGSIASTTKPGWSGVPLLNMVRDALGVTCAINTDVNGAALAEYKWGAAQRCDVAVYVTIGTGIGGGMVVGGQSVIGNGHPEMGHFRLARHADDADFTGICPFHTDCAEGLASGPAIIARWGASLSKLAPDHPAHMIIAYYLGQLCVALQAIAAPNRIILGGGVGKSPGLIENVRAAATVQGGDYFAVNFADIIVAPGLGENSGLLGAFELAERALLNL
jgi:fructokinase